MAKYEITFARSARKELDDFQSKIVSAFSEKLKVCKMNHVPAAVKKLVGEKNLWRIKAGDYRVLYSIDDEKEIVDIIAIRHRRDVYR